MSASAIEGIFSFASAWSRLKLSFLIRETRSAETANINFFKIQNCNRSIPKIFAQRFSCFSLWAANMVNAIWPFNHFLCSGIHQGHIKSPLKYFERLLC